MVSHLLWHQGRTRRVRIRQSDIPKLQAAVYDDLCSISIGAQSGVERFLRSSAHLDMWVMNIDPHCIASRMKSLSPTEFIELYVISANPNSFAIA